MFGLLFGITLVVVCLIIVSLNEQNIKHNAPYKRLIAKLNAIQREVY